MKKTYIVFTMLILLSTKVFSQAISLDEAIKTTVLELEQQINGSKIPNISFSDKSIGETASEIRRQLSIQVKIAVLNFSSSSEKLSAYVIDELNNAIVRNGSLTVVDRQQLDLARGELRFQMTSDVDDNSAQSVGKFLGAQLVLSGSFTTIGDTYRFRIRVIAVETGILQYSNSINIKPDSLEDFMPKEQSVPKHNPKPYREPLETEPIFNLCLLDVGGGSMLGFEYELGLQAGASVGILNFLIDASGGMGGHNQVKGNFHLGGIIELRFLNLFLLGLGGGYGGMAEEDTLASYSRYSSQDEEINPDFSYPYLRGSISFAFGDYDDFGVNIGVYYDYNFDYDSKIGLRLHLRIL